MAFHLRYPPLFSRNEWKRLRVENEDGPEPEAVVDYWTMYADRLMRDPKLRLTLLGEVTQRVLEHKIAGLADLMDETVEKVIHGVKDSERWRKPREALVHVEKALLLAAYYKRFIATCQLLKSEGWEKLSSWAYERGLAMGGLVMSVGRWLLDKHFGL